MQEKLPRRKTRLRRSSSNREVVRWSRKGRQPRRSLSAGKVVRRPRKRRRLPRNKGCWVDREIAQQELECSGGDKVAQEEMEGCRDREAAQKNDKTAQNVQVLERWRDGPGGGKRKQVAHAYISLPVIQWWAGTE